jgi:hypothetical protein
MRTEKEVADYAQQALQSIAYVCKECGGLDIECQCHKRVKMVISAYEACIPRDFWNVKPKDV